MILYDWESGLNYRETHAHLVAASENQVLSGRTVFNCFDEYGRRKSNIFDAHRLGRSRTVVIEEMIDAIRLLIKNDPHMTY